jgi:hypothetical protein
MVVAYFPYPLMGLLTQMGPLMHMGLSPILVLNKTLDPHVKYVAKWATLP